MNARDHVVGEIPQRVVVREWPPLPAEAVRQQRQGECGEEKAQVTLTKKEALLQGAGFLPQRKARLYEDKDTLRGLESFYGRERDRIYDKYKLGDKEEAKLEMKDYNARLKEEGLNKIIPRARSRYAKRGLKKSTGDKRLQRFRGSFLPALNE